MVVAPVHTILVDYIYMLYADCTAMYLTGIDGNVRRLDGNVDFRRDRVEGCVSSGRNWPQRSAAGGGGVRPWRAAEATAVWQ